MSDLTTEQFFINQLTLFKRDMESAITSGATKGLHSAIRSSKLINYIHDAVKYAFLEEGIPGDNIMPPFGASKPELTLAGFLKQKSQDICIVPSRIAREETAVEWGPMAFEGKKDAHGHQFSASTLVVNVRSQMSSLAKNADTLFERTFAESFNLHLRYPDMVLGEVYLIPTHEYDPELASTNKVGFRTKSTNIERYVSFFSTLSGRPQNGEGYMYEKCALLVVDFRGQVPTLYQTTEQLKDAGLVANDFSVELANIGVREFAADLLEIYSKRFDITNFYPVPN